MKPGRILAPLALLSLVSCASTSLPRPVHFYRGPALDEDGPRRVVLLPLGSEAAAGADAVTGVFATELSKLGLFDVVPVPESALPEIEGRRVRLYGVYRLEDLIEIGRRHLADGVLVGSVTDYRPYPPLRLGMRLELLSTRTGRVLWSADASFDAHDRGTRSLIRRYHRKRAGASDSLMEGEVYLVSIDRFTRFACHQVVRTLEKHPSGTPEDTTYFTEE